MEASQKENKIISYSYEKKKHSFLNNGLVSQQSSRLRLLEYSWEMGIK